jgi:ubiquitin-like-conjugating enzyme ATG3
MWLMGYDEHKRPLTPSQTFADISSDYAQKTVTIEPFPHLNGLNLASVHPCKHSSVMKKMIERMDGSFKEAQQKNAASGGNGGSISKKKGWIGGVVKKATGGSGGIGSSSKDKKSSNPATSPAGVTNTLPPDSQEPEIEGLRVDQLSPSPLLPPPVSFWALTSPCFFYRHLSQPPIQGIYWYS